MFIGYCFINKNLSEFIPKAYQNQDRSHTSKNICKNTYKLSTNGRQFYFFYETHYVFISISEFELTFCGMSPIFRTGTTFIAGPSALIDHNKSQPTPAKETPISK